MSMVAGILNVGPIRVVLYSADSTPIHYDDWAHREFFSPVLPPPDSSPVVELPVHIVRGTLRCPDGVPLFESGNNWAVWPDGDCWFFASGYANRETPHRVFRVSRALDRATLHVNGDPADAPLRYPLDQILMWGLLGRCGGLLLHASGVVRDGAGHVFAGRSGAGKSTLSAFCHVEGWDVLNDDRVMVWPDAEGCWQVSGTPWHGSGCYARNQTVPLRALYMLQQDVEDRLEPMPARDARLALLDVSAIPWFEDDWSQSSMHALERLTADIGVYRFRFTRSETAVRALCVGTGMEANGIAFNHRFCDDRRRVAVA